MMNERLRNSPVGVPFYLQVTGGEPGESTSAMNVMQMGHYVNPELALNTDYFRSLDRMMQCVEKNAHVSDPAQQERVCASEFRNLRLAAFNNKLLYSEVNKRFFIRELQFKNNYGAW
uniref:Uncharacterized protein n=1 Tax=Favella ehrenbergii TaxID=182087 RepID=A0A7S3I7G4_9SPIT|mmetsp:Transcript_767/g.1153  ORF Transcript_767/g.1153 Transcript_767/m.1153 type:complete len:117 (+) Transcript_767:118-468(+)